MLYDVRAGADSCSSLGLGANSGRTNPEQKNTGFSISPVSYGKFVRVNRRRSARPAPAVWRAGLPCRLLVFARHGRACVPQHPILSGQVCHVGWCECCGGTVNDAVRSESLRQSNWCDYAWVFATATFENNHVNDTSRPSRNGWVIANRPSPQVAPVTSI